MYTSTGKEIQERYRTAYRVKTRQARMEEVPEEQRPAISHLLDLTLDELQVGGWGFHNALT